MCGRYTLIPDARAWADVGTIFGKAILTAMRAQEPRYNVAPTQAVPILVIDREGPAQLIQARWGYVPSWWRKPQMPTMTTNARSETAASKPMWQQAWQKQRCLIPASNWYEWYQLANGTKSPPKVPHNIQRADGEHIMFAGLWSWWPPSPEVEPIATCAIVTVASAPDIAEIHERTPVVLDPKHWQAWLDPGMTDADEASRIIREGAVEQFRMHSVGRDVGNARNQGPSLVEPMLFPEMEAQGRAAPTKTALAELRTTPSDRLGPELLARLYRDKPNAATRRLWLRELHDRDDVAAFGEIIAAIDDSLRVVKRKKPPEEPTAPQPSLF